MHPPPPGLTDFFADHDDIAVALDRRTGIIAASAAATAAWTVFRTGQNIARAIFLDPELDDVVEHLPVAIAQTVALLRDGLAEQEWTPDDIALIGELTSRSPAFARLWASDEPLRPTGRVTVRAVNPAPHDDGFDYAVSPWAGDPGIRILTWRRVSP